MARIRTIKPEFCQSEKIGRLSRDARLLFVKLWPFVDDHGRCRGNSRLLAANLFPYDDDAGGLIDGWLAELEREGCVRRYIIDDQTYLDIPNWGKHQRIDNAGKSQIPEYSPNLAANRREPPLYLGPSTLDIGPRTKTDIRAVGKPTRTSDWPSDYQIQFWNVYPRKAGKQGAIRELERVHKRGAVPWEKLICAVRAYAATADPQFTKHPKTWLFNGCWDDEPDTRKQNGQTPKRSGITAAIDGYLEQIGSDRE